MQKITWRKTTVDEDGKPMVDDDGDHMISTYHGKNLGPIVRDGVTMLVIYCEDASCVTCRSPRLSHIRRGSNVTTIIGRTKDANQFVDRLKRREKPARATKAKAKPKTAKPKVKRR